MNDWERFFDSFAPRYDDEVFCRNTEAEVRFVVEQLRLGERARVIDLGCGTGRHSVGLARLGMRVTGVDVSSGMLELARRRATDGGAAAEFVRADAAAFVRPESFDAAICLCEGAMCLLSGNDDPFERDMVILRNVFASLVSGGPFLLNVLNGCRHIRMHSDEDVTAGRYDVLTLSETSDVPQVAGIELPAGALRERGYTPPEIRHMLSWTGFEVHGIYGGTAGAWNMQPPKLDEIELMVMARKPR